MGDTTVDNGVAASGVRGFTLLELLVTIAVAAVLLAIAIPSYRGVVQRNAVAAGVNDLVGDLNYARSQAVTRGQPVLLCQSSNHVKCTSDGADWSRGWIVYAPAPGGNEATADNRLRVKSAFDGQIAITGNGNLEKRAGFDANGFARQADGSLGNGTFTVTSDVGDSGTDVVVAPSGRIRSQPTTGKSS